MTALIDWRHDAELPSRTVSWTVWTLGMVLVATVAAALVVVATGPASGVSTGACRLREESQGIRGLDKMDVPAVGQQAPPGWVPPKNVRVRYAPSADEPSGWVVDETMCGQPDGQLLVTIAR